MTQKIFIFLRKKICRGFTRLAYKVFGSSMEIRMFSIIRSYESLAFYKRGCNLTTRMNPLPDREYAISTTYKTFVDKKYSRQPVIHKRSHNDLQECSRYFIVSHVFYETASYTCGLCNK